MTKLPRKVPRESVNNNEGVGTYTPPPISNEDIRNSVNSQNTSYLDYLRKASRSSYGYGSQEDDGDES